MIPRMIHYCWYGGAPFGGLANKCLASWQAVMPDFRIKRWDESNTPFDTAYSRAAHGRGAWSELSDYMRQHALHTEGGIYLDTDMELLKDLTPLLDHHCFAGFQQEEEEEDWVNTAILGARPGHELLRRCMEINLEEFAATGRFLRSPTTTTRVLKEMGLRSYGRQEVGSVSIYPIECFYPFPWFGDYSPGCVRENTYAIHHWAASWQDGRSYPLRRRLRLLKRRMGRWWPGYRKPVVTPAGTGPS